MLATLLLSQGTPLLLHGDELGRTQQGNNNVYCQDNELSWVDWDNADRSLIAFVAYVISLRQTHPIFRRMRWLHHRRGRTRNRPPAHWYRADGSPMTPHDWSNHETRAVALVLDGRVSTGVTPAGTDEFDDTFCLFFNAHLDPLQVTMPPSDTGAPWSVVIDTSDDEAPGTTTRLIEPGQTIEVADLSMIVAMLPRSGRPSQ
jgi:isoamylase